MSTPFWGPDFEQLRRTDPEIADVVLGELDRQRAGLSLVASENPASPAVLAALGSTLQNKYAEGYPGHRYYGGCEQVDRAEELANQRARDLFGAGHANVQPYSGASANLAAYAAFCRPGDTVLAMDLRQGGHLTHGSPVNFSGIWFHPVAYGVREDTELIDYDRVRELALEHRPRLIIAGSTAYPRGLDYAAFRSIADEVGAILLVDAAHVLGLVAGRTVPSPVPYADVVTATTHKTLRGPRGGLILCRAEHAGAVDRAVFPFSQGGPLMHAVAAKAVAFAEASTPEFGAYTEAVVANAAALARGLGEHGVRPVAGGTDTHLALFDLRDCGVPGAEAEQRCAVAGIDLNRNAVPYDTASPAHPSGVRVGTPTITTQGMGESEMAEIASLVARAVRSEPGTAAGDAELSAVRRCVTDLVSARPMYPRG